MDSLAEIRASVCGAIDASKNAILEMGRALERIPELGFQEYKTSDAVSRFFSEQGIPFVRDVAVTGIKADLQGSGYGPSVCVMGELDAIPCPGHPLADPATGAAHACGHHAGLTAMMGAALGLKNSGAMSFLRGRAVFLATPAEEFIQLEYRMELVKKGILSRLSGKKEMLFRGVFDDIDMAMMIHAHCQGPYLFLGRRSMGFCAKQIRFTGLEAHAAGAPHEGVNALNAASAALMLIQAQRETFRDEDGIRIHPIITKGGDAINVVPADVRMETYVRSWNKEAMDDASRKVDRALEGAAHAFGAGLGIEQLEGYLPLRQDPIMDDLMAEEAALLRGAGFVRRGGDFPNSTDAGDVSQAIRAIHPLIGGFSGAPHRKDFAVTDEEMAYVTPAKLMALTVCRLLQ